MGRVRYHQVLRRRLEAGGDIPEGNGGLGKQ
jgi:hypothetical protein